MTSLFRTRRLLLLAAMALVLPLAVACSGGGDDDDPTATTEAPGAVATSADATTQDSDTTATTAESDSTPDTDTADTPETDTTPDTDAAGTPDADSTPDSDGDSTPDTGETPDPASMETPDADTTPGSGGMVDDPFADVADVQTDVPNFTLDFTGTFENVPDDTGEIFSADLDMLLTQSEPDVYHLSFMTTGDDAIEIEVWSLPDATFIAESGAAPVELPGGFASEFAPSNVLVIVPPVDTLAAAEEVGPDEINGRDATHYRVDAEAAALILATQGVEINDPEGEMEIWLDDELGFMLQMIADVTWTNDDDTEAAVTIDYSVSDVGETDDVEAPTS